MSGSEPTTVSGQGFEYTFDEREGALVSMRRDGEELLASAPRLNVWRTPISNEKVGWGTAEAEEWRAAGLDRLAQTVEDVTVESIAEGATRVRFQTTLSAPDEEAAFATEYLYHVLGTGDVLLGVRATPNDALQQAISNWLGRVGVQLGVRDDLREFEWYGRGPQETYPDRKTGTKVDVHGGSVEDQYVPYARPQDYGNKTDVQWASVTDGDGRGLAAFGYPDLNVSAHHVDPENLDRALFNYQVRDGDAVTLNLDHAVTGVGGTPVQTLPVYRVVPDGPFSFVVGLRPIDEEASPMALSRRRLPYAFASADTFGDLSVRFDEESDSIHASATVRNTTGEQTHIEAPFAVNGTTVETDSVSLQPGTKTTVEFTHQTKGAGIFEVTVDDLPPRQITTPKISLAGEWRFHRGDDMSWKSAQLDESGWSTVTLPANWEEHSDYTKNPAFGWYRRHFSIPAEWEGHALEIPVGRIDDVDETFLNGQKIGQTGTFPTNGYDAAWSQVRRYTVQPAQINYGADNVLAVRVYDGGGGGGLYDGPLGPIRAVE